MSSSRIRSLKDKDGFSRPNVGDGFPRLEHAVKKLPMATPTPISNLDEVIVAPHQKFFSGPKMLGHVHYCYFTGSFLDWLSFGGTVKTVFVFCNDAKYLDETVAFVEKLKTYHSMKDSEIRVIGAIYDYYYNPSSEHYVNPLDDSFVREPELVQVGGHDVDYDGCICGCHLER